MRYSWNEIRVRASSFAHEWKDAKYEKADTQSFYNEFFEIFGVRRRSVARYEEHVSKLNDRSGYIDLFWPGVLIVEQKSAGRNLKAAYQQAGEYFDALSERERPQYILISDFQTFELHDLDERKTVSFSLADLPQKVELFGFILGVRRRVFRDQDPASIKAAELVGHLHDALFAAGYTGYDLERFLVRIVFCLFADDTGIFEPRDVFLEFIETRTREDGSDLGLWLSQLFQVLDTPQPERQSTLDEDLARFPYVNGKLFEGSLRIPAFNSAMRKALLTACYFDWCEISPAIFGALFQSVTEAKKRRSQGVHYTTEKNILKVIEPLFMDDLRAEFERLKSRTGSRRRADLRSFHERLGNLRFFDPACGCGNFLIIAYRELRLLEIDILKETQPRVQDYIQAATDATSLSKVNVDQFFGIEIGEFPVRIAETALWMMDHIMNNRLSLEIGQTFTRIPLAATPNIRHGDALETEWETVVSAKDCSYVLGNPPFIGAKLQTPDQRAQVRRIAALGKSGGTLDYVSAWLIKAGEYANKGHARIGFVATNSIIQGEQVAQLWPVLFDRYSIEISFAHRTFAWGSDASGKAHVHVVILGLGKREIANSARRLFSYPDLDGEPDETQHADLSPYLFDAAKLADSHLVVQEESAPINGLRTMRIGSKPIDGGRYIFNSAQRADFLAEEPDADQFLHPYVGAREYLRGDKRWILALHRAPPDALKKLPLVRERIADVRSYREASRSVSTRKLGDTPTLYHVNVLPESSFLLIPGVSSERRDYVPIGWLNPPVIPSNAAFVLLDASLSDFALLTSAMHMAWLRYIGGRLESRYRYSIGLVYNTFPLPPKNIDLSRLEPNAQAVLDARLNHSNTTLADLYDPDLMPPDLRKAHQALDKAVDRLYRRSGFSSERERVEHLFWLYEKMKTPLQTAASKGSKRRRRRR